MAECNSVRWEKRFPERLSLMSVVRTERLSCDHGWARKKRRTLSEGIPHERLQENFVRYSYVPTHRPNYFRGRYPVGYQSRVQDFY